MNNKTEKPATPRTDVAPIVGYVLSVDRKLKNAIGVVRVWRKPGAFRSKCLMTAKFLRTTTRRARYPLAVSGCLK